MKTISRHHKQGSLNLTRRSLLQAAAAAGAMAGTAPFVRAQDGSGAPLLRIGAGQAASWVRNFNPLVPDSLFPTQYAIHEPMLVFSTATGKTTPWLATGWGFSDDGKRLSFTLRDGVKWSDGQPFTARDVAFTLNLLKKNPGLSGSGGIRGVMDTMTGAAATDDRTCTVDFSRAFTPALYAIGQQSIVPEHVWKDVADPVTHANETPVGTGPFTQVTVFKPQYWELHRNPNYWQPGKPGIEGLAFPSYASNDAGTLGLINGDFEWMQLFIPDVENTFVARNPDHFRYWYPLIGEMVMLYANTATKPLDDIVLRKAIGMGVNRQQICTVAVYDYTRPADATGMSDLYAQWKDPAVVEAGKQLVSHDPAKANEMLDAAGYVRDGDVRKAPDGTPLEFELVMPSGWSDWVQGGQIIAQNLKEIGIRVKLRGVEVTAWYDATYKGSFQLSLGSTSINPTPFDHFQSMMSGKVTRPVGEVAAVNWHRYGSPRIDGLLEKFAATADEAQQRSLAREMQQAFLDEWPAIPLYPGPQWGECSTAKFKGFPSADAPYALLGPNISSESLLVLTALTPA
ncbi:MAG: ABC transporter substrate-binding protein [Inquilinus sp.]|uniref:ABC transporter substrate-binding protein n=1 Tax=Inquilinus sp. TaxID=1932117 RepID=UPI003F37AEF5